MFRNATWPAALAGPFSPAFLTGMSRAMDKPRPNLEQRELTALLHSMANGDRTALQPLYNGPRPSFTESACACWAIRRTRRTCFRPSS